MKTNYIILGSLLITQIVCASPLVINDEIPLTSEQIEAIANAKTDKELNQVFNQIHDPSLPKSGEGIVIKKFDNEPRRSDPLALEYSDRYAAQARTALDKHKQSSYSSFKRAHISLAFKYNEIDLKKHNGSYKFGAVPFGSQDEYHRWYGITEIFMVKPVGLCMYTKNYHKGYDGGIHLDENSVTKDVNGKHTVINNQGINGSGVTYDMNWFDENFSNFLTCSNLNYKIEIAKEILKLAIEIDNQQSK